MNFPTCKTCVHYRQHYTLDSQCCTRIYCGHCVYPRIKNRKPDHPACDHYAPRTGPAPLPDRSSAIHFLTKEMLEYILSLDLPPEVDGRG